MAAFHWQFRNHLKTLKKDGMLNILIALTLHADNTLRCWPSRGTLAEETDYAPSTVSKAIKGLIDMKALILVPTDKRVGKQKKLSKRKNVYQLTGVLQIGDKVVKYLHLTPEGWENVVEQMDDLGYDLRPFDPELAVAKSFKSPKQPDNNSLNTPPLSDNMGVSRHHYDEKIVVKNDIEVIPVKEDKPIKEDISASGEENPPYHIEKSKGFNPLQEAVAVAWDIRPGPYAGKIGSQLTGTAKKGDRKMHSIEPAMFPAEIAGFGMWFRRQYPEADFPQKAASIENNVDRYRADKSYDEFIKRGYTQLTGKQQVKPTDNNATGIPVAEEAEDEDLATPEEIAAAFAELDELKTVYTYAGVTA